MDQLELTTWCDFCEGRIPYKPFMLSSMFMGVFAELSEEDEADLRRMFSYVPNSSRTLEKLLRIGRPKPAVEESGQKVTDLVNRDLQEARGIVADLEVLAAIDLGVISEVTTDEARFRRVFQAPLNMKFVDSLSDYVIEAMPEHDKRLLVLDNAFYGIASSLRLQYALTADLLDLNVRFDNYFELYLRAADYALDANGALVFRHRK